MGKVFVRDLMIDYQTPRRNRPKWSSLIECKPNPQGMWKEKVFMKHDEDQNS
jgi:hypothetical protein